MTTAGSWMEVDFLSYLLCCKAVLIPSLMYLCFWFLPLKAHCMTKI